jgi:hypothetical protein
MKIHEASLFPDNQTYRGECGERTVEKLNVRITCCLLLSHPEHGTAYNFARDIMREMPLTKRFSTIRTAPFRALQIWLILIGAAHNRQTLTYKLLAERMGHAKGAGVLADQLGYVAFYCIRHNLPPLTVLVINEKTGVPGEGIPVKDVLSQREKILRFKWFDIVPPTPEELKDAAEAGRSAR